MLLQTAGYNAKMYAKQLSDRFFIIQKGNDFYGILIQ